ncbi:MAG: peptidoglycan DD-metalloendopeptidase family protein [Clostridia bacterium]|nr:peptidoglycan DD-metalloendopeptidase family protein [Clostridia bacterium]
MDKRSERKWKLRQTRLRTAIFFRRNGLYLSAFACLAVLGIAAAVLFLGDGDKPTPVGRSDDERLAEVVSTPTAGSSASPAPTQNPRNAVSPKPNITLSPYAYNVSPAPSAKPRETAVPADSPVPIPDITPHPELTADPQLSKLQPPVDGHVIRVFAMNSLIYSETLKQWMTHSGVDIAAKKGDEVYCVLSGTVENVYSDDMLGVTVVVRHANGLISVYSSLKDEPPVKTGDRVDERQVIGFIGDTAISECAERSHLHFELHYEGSPIDPESIITFNKGRE